MVDGASQRTSPSSRLGLPAAAVLSIWLQIGIHVAQVLDGSKGGTTVGENTLIRSEPCPTCGGQMLWTQNACDVGDASAAVYVCASGHVIDPTLTRQCPNCGLHDTTLLETSNGRQQYRCLRCGTAFQVPR